MRKSIANILRRLAARLDPQKPAALEVVTPLEFLTNEELAMELGRRSDRCLLYYGQERTGRNGDKYFKGSRLFRVADAEDTAELTQWMVNDLMEDLRNRAKQ